MKSAVQSPPFVPTKCHKSDTGLYTNVRTMAGSNTPSLTCASKPRKGKQPVVLAGGSGLELLAAAATSLSTTPTVCPTGYGGPSGLPKSRPGLIAMPLPLAAPPSTSYAKTNLLAQPGLKATPQTTLYVPPPGVRYRVGLDLGGKNLGICVMPVAAADHTNWLQLARFNWAPAYGFNQIDWESFHLVLRHRLWLVLQELLVGAEQVLVEIPYCSNRTTAPRLCAMYQVIGFACTSRQVPFKGVSPSSVAKRFVLTDGSPSPRHKGVRPRTRAFKKNTQDRYKNKKAKAVVAARRWVTQNAQGSPASEALAEGQRKPDDLADALLIALCNTL